MQLRDAAHALGRPIRAAPKRHKWFTKRRIAIMLAVDLVVGSVAWHYLTESHPSAVASAVEGAANDAAHGNWAALYAQTCSSDKAQTSEADFAQAGQAAVLQLGGLNHVSVTTVTATHVALGPIHVPAATASGEIFPEFGTPSTYTVTVVRELGGWKMCLSAGGYSSTALGVNVALGAGQSPAL
jgi:hypothetical protein